MEQSISVIPMGAKRATDGSTTQLVFLWSKRWDDLEKLNPADFSNLIPHPCTSRQWDLICDRSALGSLALSAYQMGYMFSGIIIGHISDNYGRKTALIVSILIEIISGFGITLSPSIYVFIVVRFIHGIGGFGRYLSSLLISRHYLSNQLRFSHNQLTNKNFLTQHNFIINHNLSGRKRWTRLSWKSCCRLWLDMAWRPISHDAGDLFYR